MFKDGVSEALCVCVEFKFGKKLFLIVNFIVLLLKQNFTSGPKEIQGRAACCSGLVCRLASCVSLNVVFSELHFASNKIMKRVLLQKVILYE
jgi:hypothetical protein